MTSEAHTPGPKDAQSSGGRFEERVRELFSDQDTDEEENEQDKPSEKETD